MILEIKDQAGKLQGSSCVHLISTVLDPIDVCDDNLPDINPTPGVIELENVPSGVFFTIVVTPPDPYVAPFAQTVQLDPTTLVGTVTITLLTSEPATATPRSVGTEQATAATANEVPTTAPDVVVPTDTPTVAPTPEATTPPDVGSVRVYLKDENRQPIPGGCAQLLGENRYVACDNVAVDPAQFPGATAVDDSDAREGIIRLSDVPFGSYAVKIVVVPAGFNEPDPLPLELTPDERTKGISFSLSGSSAQPTEAATAIEATATQATGGEVPTEAAVATAAPTQAGEVPTEAPSAMTEAPTAQPTAAVELTATTQAGGNPDFAEVPFPAIAGPNAVVVVGDFQDKLGCEKSDDPKCEAVSLQPTDDGIWNGSFPIPAGTHSFYLLVKTDQGDIELGDGGKVKSETVKNIQFDVPEGAVAVYIAYNRFTGQISTVPFIYRVAAQVDDQPPVPLAPLPDQTFSANLTLTEGDHSLQLIVDDVPTNSPYSINAGDSGHFQIVAGIDPNANQWVVSGRPIKPATLVVHAVDANGNPVNGTCFALLDNQGHVLAQDCDSNDEQGDDGNTTLHIPEGLADGAYRLAETKPADGQERQKDAAIQWPIDPAEVTFTVAP